MVIFLGQGGGCGFGALNRPLDSSVSESLNEHQFC